MQTTTTIRSQALAAARSAASASNLSHWPLTVSVPLPEGLDFEDECSYEDTFVAEYNKRRASCATT